MTAAITRMMRSGGKASATAKGQLRFMKSFFLGSRMKRMVKSSAKMSHVITLRVTPSPRYSGLSDGAQVKKVDTSQVMATTNIGIDEMEL